jgi:pentatricopeptide repeat protein
MWGGRVEPQFRRLFLWPCAESSLHVPSRSRTTLAWQAKASTDKNFLAQSFARKAAPEINPYIVRSIHNLDVCHSSDVPWSPRLLLSRRMSLPKAICLQCRSKLIVQRLGRTSTRWQSNSTFSSLLELPPSSTEPDSNGDKKPPIASKSANANRRHARRDRALDLFEKTLDRTAPPEPAAKDGVSSDAKLYQLAAKLREMTSADESAATTASCFALLRNEIIPAVRESQNPPHRALYMTISQFLSRAASQKTKDPLNLELPSVTQICEAWTQNGNLDATKRLRLAVHLIEGIVNMSTSPEDYPSVQAYESSLASLNPLLDDLVEFWKHLSTNKRWMVGKNTNRRFVFPPIRSVQDAVFFKKKNTRTALESQFAQYSTNQLGELTPALLATYAILTDPQKNNRPGLGDQLVKQLGTILRLYPLQPDKLRYIFQDRPLLGQYVLSQWPTMLETLDSANQIHRTPVGKSRGHTAGLKDMNDRLSVAFKARDLREIDRLWDEFSHVHGADIKAKNDHLRDLIDHFLLVYCSLKENKMANRVAEFMKELGLQPNLKTFTNMIAGWNHARDSAAIERLWKRITQAAFPLDTAIWTARISSLYEAGQFSAGYAALVEMIDMWNVAETSGEQHTAVKLTIEPINAALASLLRHSSIDSAKSVLALAADANVEPNVITFNTLLQRLIRDNQLDEVSSLLQQMKASDVQADSATFTIIVERSLDFPDEMSSEARVEAVQQFLSELVAAGLEPKRETYAKMCHVLLQSKSSNTDAPVKAVLAHMWASGVRPSPHIYTILIDHYFSRQPPDLDAVRSLLANIQQRDPGNDAVQKDRVFRETLLRGYAVAGEVADAADLFRELSKSGVRVTLSTSEALLRMYIRQQDSTGAKRVVRDMVEQAKTVTNDRYMKHAVWHLVRDYGLLEGLDAQGLELPSRT